MQAGIIVRGFIASPSDVQQERERALNVVTIWNAVNSLDRSMVIEAVRIETHAEAQLGRHPQEIINTTLLDRCDFLIAIFWSRLGTPTDKAVSGTADEIDSFTKAKGGDKVKLFFSERDLPHDHKREELARLDEFKKEMQTRSLYIPFVDVGDFAEKLRNQLDIVMNKLDKSEERKELWSNHAILSERARLEIDKERYAFQKQAHDDSLVQQMREQYVRDKGPA